MSKNTKTYTQNKAVISYMSRRPRSKMTTAQIRDGIAKNYKMKLSNIQVSKCLNRFCDKNLIGSIKGSVKNIWFYTPQGS